MRKLLFALLAAFALTSATAQEAFPDIPAGHWAGEAVSRIADLGIVIGFPDGTFRGNESFTRYQAALVVSRLLDVIQQNFDALAALTAEDLASLRNAIQELASDVAAQGVRLDAVEGQVASLGDDVAANTARLDELEMMGMDDSLLEDLRNQIASLRVAADTAAAQAAAAEALARDADARSRQNADAIANLEELIRVLNNELDSLGGAPSVTPGEPLPEGLLDQVARNTSDIANIREFVILLRRDQVALRDRVAALEAADIEQAARIDDLDARLTAVEEQLLLVSGSIGLTYTVGRLSGSEVPFDVDRIFGLNNDRNMGASVFSTGAADLDDSGSDTGVGEVAQDRQEITSVDGNIEPSVTLNIGFNVDRAGVGGANALANFESVLTLTLQRAENLCSDAGYDEVTESVTCAEDDLFDGYVFAVDSFTSNFTIGSAPLSFQFGTDIMVELTPYILDFDDGLIIDSAVGGDDVAVGVVDGFVATIGAPDFLAFLNPTLTFVYGSENEDEDATTDDDRYYRAIRATLNPLQGEVFSLTLGGTFAQHAFNAGENADAAGDNVDTTVYGVDGQIGVSFLDINFAYNVSSTTPGPIPGTTITGEQASSSMAYVQLNADVESLPILDSFSANYRDIPGIWGGMADPANYVFDLDQAGFKVEAGLSLFIVELDAYFDTYATSEADNTTAFGVDAAVELFRAFSLTGFFSQVSVDGDVVDSADAAGTQRDDSGYRTGFGVGLMHDGAAENALIPNLNLDLRFERLGAGFNETHILAAADYTLAISILTLTPYVAYETFNDEDPGSDDTVQIKAGTGLTTTPLDIFLQPSLTAAVNYRTRSHDDTGEADPTYTTTEFQWSVGLMLNEFLFDNSNLTAKYGSYTGTNMDLTTNTRGSGDNATDISGRDQNNGATQATTGYEIIWNYFDLELAYGAYLDTITDAATTGVVGSDPAGNRATGGQRFRISYTVTF